jgi:hypothetical protein
MQQDIANHVDFLNPKSGKLLAYYENKAQSLAKRARWAQGIGATDLANLFFKESSKMSDASRNMSNIMNKASSKTGKHWITWYANRDGVINPVTGKEMKRGESFPELVNPADAGAMSRDGFSSSVPPKLGDDGSGWGPGVLAHNREVFDTAEKRITKITAPNGMIIPNTSKNTKMYRAVADRFDDVWKKVTAPYRKTKEPFPEYLGTDTAAAVIDEIFTRHVQGQGIIESLKAGLLAGEQITPATKKAMQEALTTGVYQGNKITRKEKQEFRRAINTGIYYAPVTPEDRKAMQADLKRIRGILKYNPNFELKLGNEKDEIPRPG